MRKLYLAVTLHFAGTLFSAFAAENNAADKASQSRTKKYAEFSKLPELPPETEMNADAAKLKYLSGKKMDIMLKMHETRIKLIKQDPRLAALRKRILSLTLELSQELNAKREMYELNNSLAAVEDAMKEILAKQKEAEKKVSTENSTEKKEDKK